MRRVADPNKHVVFDRNRRIVATLAKTWGRATRSQLADLVPLLVDREQATGRTAEPDPIEWTPQAGPFFEPAASVRTPPDGLEPRAATQRSRLVPRGGLKALPDPASSATTTGRTACSRAAIPRTNAASRSPSSLERAMNTGLESTIARRAIRFLPPRFWGRGLADVEPAKGRPALDLPLGPWPCCISRPVQVRGGSWRRRQPNEPRLFGRRRFAVRGRGPARPEHCPAALSTLTCFPAGVAERRNR